MKENKRRALVTRFSGYYPHEAEVEAEAETKAEIVTPFRLLLVISQLTARAHWAACAAIDVSVAL